MVSCFLERRVLAGLCLCATSSLALGCYTGVELDGSEPGDGVESDSADAGDPDDDDGGSGDETGGEPSEDPESCDAPSVGFVGYRRLTRAQYDNAIRDLLGFDDSPSSEFTPDEKIGPFTSNSVSPVGTLQLEQYMRAAEDLAVRAVEEDLAGRVGCEVPASGQDWADSDCLAEYIGDFGARVYRRPLDAAEQQRYRQMYGDAIAVTDDAADGIRVVIQAMLQSPFFLYHLEIGEPLEGGDDSLIALTDHEVASRLSFLLWNTIPDDTLRTLADAGSLSTPDQIEEEAMRMLQDPRARDGITQFHTQWLEIEDLESVAKNPEAFPGFDAALAEAMQEDTAEFAYRTLVDGDGTLDALLLGNQTYTEDPALLELYGVERPAGHVSGEPIPLDASQRAGLLTQPSVLATHAHAEQTSPVHRGVFVRQNMLCFILPSPPPDVDDTPPDPDPNATTRERFDEHTADPSCAGCHVLIDPIGFGFENYDAIGAFRSEENGIPVDASGELASTVDIDGTFDGAIELSERLASSTQVQQCVSRQWFRFAFGRMENEADTCSLETMDALFADSGHHIPTLIGALVRTDAFRLRAFEGS